jgi:DNA (cytosine-5)-methyltransferase 1
MPSTRASQTPSSDASRFPTSPSTLTPDKQTRVAELFAGVGGFHLGLARSGWKVIWANQFEPGSLRVQHAHAIYCRRFEGLAATESVSNEDIADVAQDAENLVPDHELLVGGFPCQDYSVAKPLPKATGLGGKKGVLWWEIFRILRAKRPPMVLLENVDRLLSSPASHRGRDFAIMLACFDSLGYTVEWRIVTADDYGFPQRRRRVFIVARQGESSLDADQLWARLTHAGVLARALPVEAPQHGSPGAFTLPRHEPLPHPDQRAAFEAAVRYWVYRVGAWERLNPMHSPFHNAGVMSEGLVLTDKMRPDSACFLNRQLNGRKKPWRLGQVVAKTTVVPVDYFVRQDQKGAWETHKGAKSLERTKGYFYSEGGMSCPDSRERASRTIITSEGGRSPSRFKHIIAVAPTDRIKYVKLADGRRVDYLQFIRESGEEFRTSEDPVVWRRLIPEELEELNGFRRGWTRVSLNGSGPVSDTRRAFLMGNALVVGVVAAIGRTLMSDWRG